jgi:hypothetical protein
MAYKLPREIVSRFFIPLRVATEQRKIKIQTGNRALGILKSVDPTLTITLTPMPRQDGTQ